MMKMPKNFFNGTVNADISHNYEKFVELLPENAYILDVGCGSGRETKVFMDLGFNVFAFDGSLLRCVNLQVNILVLMLNIC